MTMAEDATEQVEMTEPQGTKDSSQVPESSKSKTNSKDTSSETAEQASTLQAACSSSPTTTPMNDMSTPPPSQLRKRHTLTNPTNDVSRQAVPEEEDAWRNDAVPALSERITQPSRNAFYKFFYTTENTTRNAVVPPPAPSNDEMDNTAVVDADHQTSSPLDATEASNIQQQSSLDYHATQEQEDKLFTRSFWKGFDDWILLSLFGFLGILFRLAAANWFAYFDDVFNADSALFRNLPLNCLSCFFLGLLGSGNELFERIEQHKYNPQPLYTRTTAQQQQQQQEENSMNDHDLFATSSSLNPSPEDDLRQVQMEALERRIRASPCLVLFPIRKEEMDVMDHYVNDGRYLGTEKRSNNNNDSLYDLNFTEEQDEDERIHVVVHHQDEDSDELSKKKQDAELNTIREADDPAAQDYDKEDKDAVAGVFRVDATTTSSRVITRNGHAPLSGQSPTATTSETPVEGQGLDQFIHGVSANIQGVSTNITTNMARLNRVNLADGWDDGTSARTMSSDLLLGLRTGFCGALSSFSSWNSSMVRLLRNGYIGQAVVGYAIGLQLPIVSYRFGQHAALYLFVWRCRRETRRDERRGYGLRLRQDDDDDDCSSTQEDEAGDESANASDEEENNGHHVVVDEAERRTLSVRAVATAIFILAIVLQIVSINIFTKPQQQQNAISLLFSPLGVLTRWRLSKWNTWRAGFPLGTFTANMLACMLSGGLGSLLAGNPGPEESIVLVGIIGGFSGALSSLAQLIVEILAGIDPIIFKYSGITYAVATIWWGFVIGIVTQASMDWADEI